MDSHVLFLFAWCIYTSAGAPPPYTCPKIECACTELDKVSFKASCPPEEHGTQYAVTYNVADGNVMFDCVREFKLNQNILGNFRFTKPVAVHFRMCLEPTVPFREILQSINVTGLFFSSYQNWSMIDEELFVGLFTLKTLNLNGNNFRNINVNVFAPLVTLMNLSLAENALETFPRGLGNILHQIKVLDLSKNNISKIKPEEIANLTKLRELNLSNNSISMITEGTFADLVNLEILDLRSNLIITIRPQLLENMTNLKSLDISYNKIRSLPETVFRRNNRLQNLYITNHKNLTEIGETLLNNLTMLEELDLQGNNLSSLPTKFLFTQHSLLKLYLQFNRISVLDSQLLAWCTDLEYLDLSNNKIKEIPRGFFKNQANLKRLSLQNNQIRTLNANTFSGITIMHFFDISNNGLRIIDENAFANSGVITMNFSNNEILFTNNTNPFLLPDMVEHINFTHTFLTWIPLIWTRNPTLRELDLQRNRVMTLHVEYPLPPNTPHTLNINLEDNVIENVVIINTNHPNTKDSHLEKFIIKYNLENNLFRCDCNLLSFARYLRRENYEPQATVRFDGLLKCISPVGLESLRVESLNDNQFECRMDNNCPSQCYCLTQGFADSVRVQCSQQELSEIPSMLPPGISSLDLSSNRIERLYINMPPAQWNRIINLDLSYNMLSDLSYKIDLPKNLRTLAINHNQLHEMPDWLMNEISFRDIKVHLGNNPWDCICKATPFQQWLEVNHDRVGDLQNIICMQPEGKIVPLVDVNSTDLCVPVEQIHHHTSTGVVILICMCILLLLTFVIAMGLKYKARVKMWLFRRHMCLWMWEEDDRASGHPL